MIHGKRLGQCATLIPLKKRVRPYRGLECVGLPGSVGVEFVSGIPCRMS